MECTQESVVWGVWKMDERPHTQAQGRTIVLVHCSSQCAVVVVVISLLSATLALFTAAEKQPVA